MKRRNSNEKKCGLREKRGKNGVQYSIRQKGGDAVTRNG